MASRWMVRESPARPPLSGGRNPKAVGERSEGAVIAALLRAGEIVLIAPFSDNQRYDLVIDRGDRFLRVQVKTGRLHNGRVLFAASSSQNHRGRGRQPYTGQADYFAVYVPPLDRIYWVPVAACPTSAVALRLERALNGQQKCIRWASDYEHLP